MPIYRGRVVTFDAGTYTARVRLDGSAAQTLDSVAVSRGLASTAITTGRRVLVDTGDHADLADIVVFAVCG
jgi:hypothetical protein